ncbi:MAG: hypothetical protein ACLFR2_09335 [Candidatus Kapaibacterium sp.]
MLRCIFIFLILTYGCTKLYSQSPTRSFAVIADVLPGNLNEPYIQISWERDPGALEYRISRKLAGDDKFGATLARLSPDDTAYVDTVDPGLIYEYKIESFRFKNSAWGYIATGIEVPPVDNRGRILLLIDEVMADSLVHELERLEFDLIGDGWEVIRREAPRAEEFSGSKVLAVKDIIREEFAASDSTLRSIFMIGRVPVPYSGDTYIDGHENHQGAWPTDAFYSELDAVWTDTLINFPSASDFPRNYNVPGDGKFDQSFIPSPVDLEAGRVDMYNLTDFEQSEAELLRNYLNKNHAWRNGETEIPYKSIVTDGLGLYGNNSEYFGANGWMMMSSLFNTEDILDTNLRYVVMQDPYLMAYACNSGSFNSVALSAYSVDYARNPVKAAFLFFLGSYLADWDSENNILRSGLASDPYVLAACFTGRPYWHIHHMGMGKPIGYSYKISINNLGLYDDHGKFGHRFNHIALMGDPAIRLHVAKPPRDLSVNYINSSKIIELSWNDPEPESAAQYHVYKAFKKKGPYNRITELPITKNNFIDSSIHPGYNYYMVKSIELETRGEGTYYNTATGIFTEIFIEFPDIHAINARVFPNPGTGLLNMAIETDPDTELAISLFNAGGVEFFNDVIVTSFDGTYNYILHEAQTLVSGVYFIKLESKEHTRLIKYVHAN